MATKLLLLVIQAHGGMHRWKELSRFRATASVTGAIWALKGKPGMLDDVLLDGETRSQRLRISPFPPSGTSAVWAPYRQTIETDDGVPVVARADPAGSFAGLGRDWPWDDLHVAYVASEGNWNYLVSPILFARPDFVTEEFEPWHEDGEVWRSLVVTSPDTVVAHTRQQTYHFDGDGLLRRIDSSVDILGGGPAVHYPSDYQEFDGIMVPTRRRVFVRNPDGTPVRDRSPLPWRSRTSASADRPTLWKRGHHGFSGRVCDQGAARDAGGRGERTRGRRGVSGSQARG